MYKKLFYSACFVLVLSIAITNPTKAQDPNLVGWWTLDEDSGTIAYDSTDYWNDGTLSGGPLWVEGRIGGALDLDGTNDYVNCGTDASFDITGQITLAVWIKARAAGNDAHQHYVGKGNNSYCIKQNSWNNIEVVIYIGGWKVATLPLDSSYNDVWHYLAGTYDGSQIKLYVDGVLQATTNQTGAIATNADPVRIGTRDGTRWYYNGLIDDVRIYNRALSSVEIKKLASPERASAPIPADSGVISQPEVTLQWEAGINAASHNVYFSDNEQAVIEGTAPVTTVSQTSHGPLSLDLGTTYYWRVDEVEADGTTVHAGEVWSFTVQPLTAYSPEPSDGARYVDPNTDLAWSPGFKALSHDVYLGTNETAVANADNSSAEFKGNQTALTYKPAALAHDTLYFWRIDEQNDDMTVSKGDVWRFGTIPEILVTEPNLVGWWKLDDGQGNLVLDWSSLGNHGTVLGDPNWVQGQLGSALDLDGFDDCVDVGDPNSLNITDQISLLAWIKTGAASNSADQSYITKGNDSYALRHSGDNNLQFRISETIVVGTPVQSSFNDIWHHLAGTYDGNLLILYVDGESQSTTVSTGAIAESVYNVNIGRESVGNRFYYDGVIDDVRIYNLALTEEEIKQAMRGEPLLTWNPSPTNGKIMDIEHIQPLSWSPGDEAVQHDVYFGIDKAAVETADTSDATGIYRGRQDPNTYTPPEALEIGQTYYWRIDEYNTDATISKGRIWGFTIANYLIVDDFEDYDDVDNRIYYTWEDYYANNTGMTVGHLDPPFAEQDIVHIGRQSMYMRYDNDGTVNEGTDFEQTGTLFYSEAQRSWEAPQDWTRRDVTPLTLWLRGIPASVGSFTAGPPIQMTAGGTDIWGTADEFHYAYKRLSGEGSITAKVVSITNTDPWAKAGVMIRQTLEPGSANVMVAITSTSGVTFQNRNTAGAESLSTTQEGIAAPQWVRMSRSGNTFTGEYSADGSNWTIMDSVDIPMLLDIYIGLCLTSHNVDETCTAEFSDINTSATVTGDWQSQDIGIESNVAEPMYVVLEDSAGNSSVVTHSDPAATTIGSWTQWSIPLTDFTGLNLQAVKSMAIGVGDRANTQPGGAGTLYIDDIWLYIPLSEE